MAETLQGKTSSAVNMKGWLSIPKAAAPDPSIGATAGPEDIAFGKTAAVGGKLITGTYVDVSKDADVTPEDIRQGKHAAVNGELIEGTIEEINGLEETTRIYPTGSFTVQKNTLYTKDAEVTVNMDEIMKDLRPDHIKDGVVVRFDPASHEDNIDQVTGIYTSNATATPNDVAEGKIFYANGKKQVGIIKSWTNVNNMDCFLTFGSTIPTHGCKLTVYDEEGSPYLKVYHNRERFDLVEVPKIGGIAINENGDVLYIQVTDATGADKIETLEQAKTSIQFFYNLPT